MVRVMVRVRVRVPVRVRGTLTVQVYLARQTLCAQILGRAWRAPGNVQVRASNKAVCEL